jgi:two-component system, NarL family, sensor histidine kinase DegS
MDLFSRFRIRKNTRLSANPHFWMIILITVLIIFLYSLFPLFKYRPEWLWHLQFVEYQIQFHGILFCIPIIYASAIFWWRGAIVTWLISAIVTSNLAFYYRPFPIPILVNLFYLFIPVLAVGYIALELNWREKERKALVEREEERQTYVSQIFRAQEDERKRIAQELHDDTIHSLLVVANRVQTIANFENAYTQNQLKEEANAIRGEILHVSDELRRLTLDLRPGILDNVGFIPAIRWLVDRLNQEGQIDMKLAIKGEEQKIHHGTDVILFRIVQEAINNIRVHSRATKANLTIEFSQQHIQIEINDNGKGFTLPTRITSLASRGKLGLIGIQERMRTIKGTYQIHSKPGQGTSISIEISLASLIKG